MKIQRGNVSDAEVLSQIATASFMSAVAPHYGSDGVSEFRGYASKEQIVERIGSGNTFYVAESGGKIVGMAEFRPPDHISMLFVLPGRQRRGVGRALLDKIIEEHSESCQGGLTVAATPNSIAAYERFGFALDGETQSVNGFVFTPMRLAMETRDRRTMP